MKKPLIIVGLLLALAAFIISTYFYYQYMYTKPLTPAEQSQLAPDWSVITGGNWSPWYDPGDGSGVVWNPIASFNAWVESIPEPDRAWPLMVDLEYKHRGLFEQQEDLYGQFPPEMQDWEALKRILSEPEMASDIERAIDALRKPTLGAMLYGTDGYDPSPSFSNATYDPVVLEAMKRHGVENPRLLQNPGTNPTLLATNLTGWEAYRHMTRLVLTDACMKLEAGDTDGWLHALETVSGSTRYPDEFPLHINQLTAIAIEVGVNRHIAYALQTAPEAFSDTQLQSIDALLERHQQRAFVWQGIALDGHDSVRRLTNDRGVFVGTSLSMSGLNGVPTEPNSLPETKLGDASQRALFRVNTTARAVSAELPWDPTKPQSVQSSKSEIAFLPGMMMDMFTINPVSLTTYIVRHRQLSIALRLVVALERHRSRHHAFPDAIDQIDADLMGFEPTDAFGGSLSFTIINDAPLVYSKSDDRDDDNGTPMLAFDIEALLEPHETGGTNMMQQFRKSRKESSGERAQPLWITIERMKEIKDVEPRAVDGDWILFPIKLDEPEPEDKYEDPAKKEACQPPPKGVERFLPERRCADHPNPPASHPHWPPNLDPNTRIPPAQPPILIPHQKTGSNPTGIAVYPPHNGGSDSIVPSVPSEPIRNMPI